MTDLRPPLCLKLLGTTELTRGGVVVDNRVLGAPKRLAMLVYLLLAEPGGFHRRDTLVSLLWPTGTEDHARASLRNALHMLRRDLDEEVIITRGADEISIAPGALQCDVLALRTAVRARDWVRIVELHRGPLLPGFFVPGADPDFEEWLDALRRRLLSSAEHAAKELANRPLPTSTNDLPRTTDPEAYALFHRGLTHLQAQGAEGLRLGIVHFQRAIAIDPGFALAHAALATAWQALGLRSPEEQLRAAREASAAAERAIAIDPQVADVPQHIETVSARSSERRIR